MNSSNSSRIAFLLLGASLAFGFTVAADKLAKGLVQSRKNPGSVSVKGLAERNLTSDLATLGGYYASSHRDLAEATKLCAETRAVVALFFTEKGVNSHEVEFAPVSAASVFERDKDGRQTTVFLHYTVSQSFKITKKDIRAVVPIAESAGELFRKGLDVSFSTPVYLVTDLESAKRGLLEEATKNARERASTLVASAGGGSGLGRLLSISQGVFTVKARDGLEANYHDSYDIKSPEKTLRLVVSADFEVTKTED